MVHHLLIMLNHICERRKKKIEQLYILCVCVCVCVCERERERERAVSKWIVFSKSTHQVFRYHSDLLAYLKHPDSHLFIQIPHSQ